MQRSEDLCIEIPESEVGVVLPNRVSGTGRIDVDRLGHDAPCLIGGCGHGHQGVPSSCIGTARTTWRLPNVFWTSIEAPFRGMIERIRWKVNRGEEAAMAGSLEESV